jgi:hypothetical protein
VRQFGAGNYEADYGIVYRERTHPLTKYFIFSGKELKI